MPRTIFKLSVTVAVLFASTTLMGCQQGTADEPKAEQLTPAALVEPIDPQTNPIGASKARKTQMAKDSELTAQLTELRQEVLALIGDARADNVQQCRVIGFGAKPCGGPAGYIAASVKDIDEATLMAKVEAYNAVNVENNNRLGLMSDCAVEPRPEVKLEQGVCRLVTAKQNQQF
ncbi:hypothetical protein [Rheinheimera sp. MMS21-TC3]|uniref:hypothetical protein n=1 Tax=Rheinheimera sp. MMS21-TC3 TaxID=3072790 RepID=UPI0028C3FEEE|nr:hypothetical protein [Rheinheimera sp. MMS21-TC3]WNO60228.1 hypothetical protein RDV63_04500 [Rheinheimera sp. MMS21-TC3]